MDRRDFLKCALSVSGAFFLGGWAIAVRAEERKRQRLVVVFLRGAVDGLSVVTPYTDRAYYAARPTIALPQPGESGGLLPLDGHFGLHPALEPLMPYWNERSLAFVHASGSPDPTRSHFDAQEYMETATPGVKKTPDGWMNRLLSVLPGTRDAAEAISLGPTLPRILAGPMPATNVPLRLIRSRPTALDRPQIEAAFDRLYRGDDPLSLAYREGQSTRKKLLADLADDMRMADSGAPSPLGFAQEAERFARMIARNTSVKLAFLALGGWDTHISQGASQGQLANRLRALGETLATLVRALGPAYQDTVVLVISEFGRTVHENGNAGTDHGHGNVMWVLGGKVRGGKIYGPWPGLSGAALYEGRDLAVATDFREVIATILEEHFGLGSGDIARVLPNAPKPSGNVRGLLRA
jgi:uncharacterized protein (DUF1501 family)